MGKEIFNLGFRGSRGVRGGFPGRTGLPRVGSIGGPMLHLECDPSGIGLRLSGKISR